jgi:two-component system, sensor histidine kinase and response regulator
MREYFRQVSLRQRLLLLTMLTSGVGVFLGCAAFLTYDNFEARNRRVQELKSVADLVGTNSAAALAFDDRVGSAKLLRALETRRNIEVGALYKKDASFLASYIRPDRMGWLPPQQAPPQGIIWSSGSVSFSSAITLNGQDLGTFYLVADLTDLRERQAEFKKLTAMVAVASLLVVYFITNALQRGVTRPIQRLAEVARAIAGQKTYSLRAPELPGKELAQLAADFNHMINEIEGRERELSEARDTLEARVNARTSELEAEVATRQRAQEALSEQTSFLDTLILTSPIAIVVQDLDGRIKTTNPAFHQLFGYAVDECQGRFLDDLIAPEALRPEAGSLFNGACNLEGVHKTVKRQRKNGTLVDVELHGVPLVIDGRLSGVFALYQDISQRVRAEERLKASEGLFRTLSDAAPVGIFRHDASDRCVYVNRNWMEMTGMSAEEALDGWRRILHPEDGTRVSDAWANAFQQRIRFTESYRYVNRDGRTLWVETIAQPTFDHRGSFEGYVGVVQDVTEKRLVADRMREAKDAAEAASRSKSEFLANMSHEIRTPMNGILGMTELALDTNLSTEQREYLEMVKSSAEGLLVVINDILDFSKIEAGRMEFERAPFSLIDCLEEALHPLGLRAREKGLELSWALKGQIPERVHGDSTRLRQILVNLVGNAIKFTKHGTVSVTASPVGSKDSKSSIQFEVADTGIGIPHEKHRRIFEAFSQADTSTTREYGGTGLGLSISARLVKLMGGEIGLESEPEHGSKFFFTLPLEPASDLEHSQLPDSAALIGKRVLVLDDNEVNRLLLARLLPQWGLVPNVFSDGESAIAEFAECAKSGNPYPLALLDQQMPGMDGFDVAAALRQYAPREQAAIFIFSSAMDVTDQQRGTELGIAKHLLKPLRRSVLRQAILEVFRSHELELSVPVRKALPKGRGLRILLAEDNRVNQKLALRILEKMGHTAVLAVNGQDAVDLVKASKFDVILMDIQMPVMGGLEAVRQIRALEHPEGRRNVVIAMTAHAMAGDEEMCLAAGMDGYVSKPIRVPLLQAEIERCLQLAIKGNEESMKVPGDGAATTDFSMTELLARVDNDRELCRELLDLFKEDAPRHLRQLQGAVAAMDASKVASEAHTLKGMLLNLSAKRAAASSATLELLAREGKNSEFAASLSAFEQRLEQVTAEIAACLVGVSS